MTATPSKHRRWILLTATLFVTFTVAMPLSYLVLPHVHRALRLSQLTSTNPHTRQRALQYLIRRASEDDRVVAGAAGQLQAANHDAFIQIFNALTIARVAVDPRVVAAVVDRMNGADEATFVQLAGLLDGIGQWRRATIPQDVWLRWLNLLAADNDFEVRIRAAQHAADLIYLAADSRLVALLRPLFTDHHEDVRYNSLIAAAELAGTLEYNQARQRYESLIFTATRDRVTTIASQAWIILGLLDPVSGFEADWRRSPPEVARAVLWAALKTNPHRPAPAVEALEDQSVDPSTRAVAAYALRMNDRFEPIDALIDTPFDHDATPKSIGDLFAAEQPTVRDLACIVAADRFSDSRNADLIASLLHDYNDDAKMSGAILAGLTGLQRELLNKKIEDEDIWAVRQIMRLGRWMQGPGPDQPNSLPFFAEMDRQAPNLLTRGDLPATTILLALLHKRHPAALDFLLNPRGEPAINLVELFDQHRWWPVVQRYLPDDAPPFWVGADPDLQRFQINVLRNWYLVNRHTLWRIENDLAADERQ
ncbi:MAG: hypothetical protein V3U29_10760 [Phycisphaeraceae bacterium]